jgi:hypothetical protein
MADGVLIDRLRLRLPAGSAADARTLATRIAEALAVGAPDLDPGAEVPLLRVRLSHDAATSGVGLGKSIAAAVLRSLDTAGT